MKRVDLILGCAVTLMAIPVAGMAQSGMATAPTAQSSDASLVVPAGTVVPLTLVNMIKTKSTAVGGTVRATVAFPVTVGTRLAIPEGVYVEGELIQAAFPKGYKQPKGVPPASPLKVHFTKLIYPNGYTVSLDAQVSAVVNPVANDGEQVAAVEWPTAGRTHGPSAGDPYEAIEGEPQQQPNPPVTNPFAHAGPNPAVIYGPILGSAVIFTAVILAGRHHGESLDSVAFGAGYPFEMTLAAPLVLDRARVGKEAAVGDVSPQ